MNIPPPAAAERRRFWRQLLEFWHWIVERDELPRDEEKTSTQRTGPSPFGWLASSDPLPSLTDSRPRRRGFLRWLASRDPLPSRTDSPPRHRGFILWLASRHPLPSRLGSPPRHSGFLLSLASREPLSSRSVSPHRHPGFLAWLTAREEPPAGSPERKPASRSFLSWLLTSESHDRLKNLHSTKEVPPHES